MTVYAITDTKKGRTGIAPTYLHTTRPWFNHIGDTVIVGRLDRDLQDSTWEGRYWSSPAIWTCVK